MSKKVIEDSELQKLTLSSTNTNEDENIPFLPKPVTDTSSTPKYSTTTLTAGPKFSTSASPSQTPVLQQAHDKKRAEKVHSGPLTTSRIPSFRLSTPNSQGYTRVSYSNERKQENKKSERPILNTPPPKRESSGIFSRTSKSSIRNSPLLRQSREEKRAVSQVPHLGKVKQQRYVPARSLTPEGICRFRGGIGGLRNFRGGIGSPSRLMDRPAQHHTFPADAADVRQIEKQLLQLMVDFEAGNLRAFGKDSRLRQMQEIREQQEKLAKLHFDVGADQELYPPLSDDGLKKSEENMRKLMNKLANLSESIEKLHSNSHLDRKYSNTERKQSVVTLHSTTINSVDVTSPGNAFEASSPQSSPPFVLQHNPSKVIQQPMQNNVSKAKETKHPVSHAAVTAGTNITVTTTSSKIAANNLFPRSASKVSSDIPIQPPTASSGTAPNAQKFNSCPSQPISNSQPTKPSLKIPPVPPLPAPIHLEPEFPIQRRMPSGQGSQPNTKMNNGETT